jgi:hypothetical protein
MSRLEYKYYIPLESLDKLRKEISPFLDYDNYTQLMPKKEYTVRSIYLDSRRLLTYHQKLAGLILRNKYRIRGYNQLSDESIIYAEIKRKENNYVSKDRIPLLYCDLENFLRTKDNSLIYSCDYDRIQKETSARNFFYYYNLLNLHPAVIITYEREAFECKFGSGLRITFDKNIRALNTGSYSNLCDEGKIVSPFKNYFVLEIKYHKVVPGWLPSIMKGYDIFRESISKYSMGIENTYNCGISNYLS